MPKNSPVKKAAPQVKKVTTKEEASQRAAVSEKTPSKFAFSIKRSYIITAITLILLTALLYYFRSFFVVAIVNGKPITRMAVIKELEKQGGQQALSSIVRKTIIEQEARKKNIAIPQEEIDKEFEKVKASAGPTFEQALAFQGMTPETYKERIYIQKLLEKVLEKDKIQVSEQEVNAFIEQNQGQSPEPITKEQAKDNVQQQKLLEKYQTWIADLEKNANITYIEDYK